MTKWILCLCAAAALAACDNHSGNESASAPAEKPMINAEQRAQLVKSATVGMSEERDKMESISFFSAKDEPWIDTGITVYLSVPDDSSPILRIVPHYHGDSWIFFNTVKVMADGKIVYERSLDGLRMKHDNNTTGVYESADYAAEAADLFAIRAIAGASSVTVRLAGEKREDVDLSPAAIARVKRVVKAYNELAAL
ncbi:hypothetical protein BSFA1_10650 [Burkholderia sp. SFA1]|nr:hypothetical protein BSFA1_10650 [Burkholderia sp. SFA1]